MPRAKPRSQGQIPVYPFTNNPRANHQQHQGIPQWQYHQVPVSTYHSDSESQTYPTYNHANSTSEQSVPPPHRTNGELNLSVLQRHYPSITSILTLAPFAVLYSFSPAAQTWEKCEVEGTLFVCSLIAGQNGSGGRESYSIAILNRKGLDNFYLEIEEQGGVEIEITDAFTIIQTGHPPNEEGGGKVWGLWMYEETTGDMRSEGSTAHMIAECAGRVARGERSALETEERVAPMGSDGVDGSTKGPNLTQKEDGQQHRQHIQPILPSPTPAPSLNAEPQTSQPDPSPSASVPQQSQQISQPLPRFQPSAETQFFLSQGRGGLQQLSRSHPSASTPPAKNGSSNLEALFAKAKSEFQEKGKL